MAGTTISDYIDRTLKLGLPTGAASFLVALLVAALVCWKAKFGYLSISGVNRFSIELMFWTTVLIANTLGTALGDWLSDNTGLGFGRATSSSPPSSALIGYLHFRTSINKVVLFWAGFVLIQPFGATAGDLWTKKPAIGGNGFPTYYASAVLLVVPHPVRLVSKVVDGGRPKPGYASELGDGAWPSTSPDTDGAGGASRPVFVR